MVCAGGDDWIGSDWLQRVYRRRQQRCSWSVPVSCGVASALSTTCTASGLTGGVSYSFEVSALSTTGESDRSSVFATSTAPAAVAGSMTFSSVTTTSMDLAWTAPSGATPTGYIVYRDDGDSATPSIVVFEGDALTATASGLTGGTSYSYMVAALSAAGVGDVSGCRRSRHRRRHRWSCRVSLRPRRASHCLGQHRLLRPVGLP